MSTGRFAVTPEELHAAASTLQGVEADLSGSRGTGAGALTVGDVGSAELTVAIHDFCIKSQVAAAALSNGITAASQRVGRGGAAYVAADEASMAAGLVSSVFGGGSGGG